ncbi:MAG: oligoendopeptidase F [Lachnospiraceae bacterium]|nr:oligoendopeptidase F [Lachnospiraceae bacterium]
MAKELLKRSEVRVEDTWKVEDMYATVEDWKADLETVKKLADELTTYQGRMGESAENLYQVMHLDDEISRIGGMAYSYASRCSDVDTTNTENQSLVMQVRTLFVTLGEKSAFVIPEILAIPEETLEQFYKEKPELEVFRNTINNLLRRKAHKLSAEMEQLLASAGDVTGTSDSVFSMFNNADIVFPEITDENGEKVRLTHGRYVPFLESGDRRVREEAFKALYATYKGFRNTLAANYAGKLKAHWFYAKARKYNSCLEAAVDATNVPASVYTNLIEAIHQNLDKMHRYVSIRKKLLGVDELHMYDLYTPLVKEADVKIPFEQAKQTVYEALAPLGEEYRAVIKEGFENRWIDVYENEGKRSGAYSAGVYGVHPYVLLNHNDTLDNMFTLAHEMGHAMHSYLSNKTQPHVDSHYVIFVAEVASTCNEVLLMEHLLKNTTDKVQRAYLINHFLESFRGTVYRQTMFAEFELLTHQMCERGESLTPDALSNLYYDLNKKYFGDDMVVDDEIAMEWARIPHFYYNFYVYQYATGFSAAVALANRILKEGQPAVEDYLKFLSGGCSKSPIDLLKIAGVDMTTPEPVNAGLEMFGRLLDEMEELMK